MFPIGTAGSEIWVLADCQQVAAGVLAAYGASGTNQSRSIRHSAAGNANASDGNANVSPQTAFQGRHVVAARWRGNGDTAAQIDRTKVIAAGVSNTVSGRFRIGANIATTPNAFFQGLISDVLVTAPLPPALADQLADWSIRRLGLRL